MGISAIPRRGPGEDRTRTFAFARPFISNPDLVERFANDWPLADSSDMSGWYSFDEKGYADFPRHDPSKAAVN